MSWCPQKWWGHVAAQQAGIIFNPGLSKYRAIFEWIPHYCPLCRLAGHRSGWWLTWHWWQCHWHLMTQWHSVRQSRSHAAAPLVAVVQFLVEFPFKIWTFAPDLGADLMAWWHRGCLGHGSMGAPGLWELGTPRHRHKWIRPGVWNSGQAHQLDPDTGIREL